MLCMAAFTSSQATMYYAGTPLNNTRDSSKPLGKHPSNPYGLQAGVNATNAGDTLFIMGGTYTGASDTSPLMKINKAGTAADPIVIINYPGHTPILKSASTGSWSLIKIYTSESNKAVNPAYITIKGLTLQGNNGSVSPTDPALETQTKTTAPAKFNGVGILITGPFAWDQEIDGLDKYNIPHHITVVDCNVSDFPSAGISVMRADYITVEACAVYNNCWYTYYGTSGINFYQATLYIENAPVNANEARIRVTRNKVYGNDLRVANQEFGQRWDGNGIIIDNFNHNQDLSDGRGPYSYPSYAGKTEVSNNAIYNNGGAGVKVYTSDNVDIYNNSFYNNQVNPYADNADLYVNAIVNLNVKNNVFSGANMELVHYNLSNAVFSNNIFTKASSISGITCSSCIIADPQYVDPGILGTSNFRVQPTSPAIDNAERIASITVDRPYNSRTAYGPMDIGAYEYPVNLRNLTADGSLATALKFDGVDDYVTSLYNTGFNGLGTANFTIEARIKASPTTGNLPTIVSNRTTGSNGAILYINKLDNGKLYLNIQGINFVGGNQNLLDNNCHHVAVVRNGSTLKFFVDGALTATRSISASIIGGGLTRIGHDAPLLASGYFNGEISEVRLWYRACLDSEIASNANKSLYDAGTFQPSGDLSEYWRLNEGNGQTAFSALVRGSGHCVLGATSAIESTDPQWVSSCTSIPKKYGSSFENPIRIGTLSSGSVYKDTRSNVSGSGYDNDFGYNNDDIFYTFTIAQKSQVKITNCGSGISDSYLFLINTQKEIITTDDDGAPCGGNKAELNYVLNAGTYYVATEGYGSTTGSITTTIEAAASNLPADFTRKAAFNESADSKENISTETALPIEVLAFPNPISSGDLNFGRNVEKYSMTDITGTEVSSGENVDHINVDTLPKGVYFINMDGKIQKVIVQ